MSNIRIGLFGFGCVGQGFYEILTSKSDTPYQIVKIAVKNSKKERNGPAELFTQNHSDILNDQEIDVIVELIDDADVAFEIVKQSLSKGIPTISANKKMIANKLDELIELQQKNKIPFLYEGAVCGSIPVLQTLNNYYSNDEINSVEGIFNGSSNYILSKITKENSTFIKALEDAQELGFAETDPTLDIGGFDPKFKLTILLKHAFGASFSPDNLLNIGIDQLSNLHFEYAKAQNLKIKLLASAKKVGSSIEAIVAPVFVSADDALYHIEDEYNVVRINNDFTHEQVLIGKGAGKLPTGLAVYSDLKSITSGYKYEYNDEFYSLDNTKYTVLISYKHSSFIVDTFEQVIEHNLGKDNKYVIGKISRNKLEALKKVEDLHISVFSENAVKQSRLNLTYSYAV